MNTETNSRVGRQIIKAYNPEPLEAIKQLERNFQNKAKKYTLRNSKVWADANQRALNNYQELLILTQEIKSIASKLNVDHYAGDTRKLVQKCQSL